MTRLTTSLQVSSLIRRVSAEGGHAAVLAKGDPTAGALILLLCEKGLNSRCYERILTLEDRYAWREIGQNTGGNPEKMAEFLEKKRGFDPDLWILELDIASPERFIDEMQPIG